MNQQPDLFSVTEAERRRDRSIDQVEANADAGFLAEARVAVKRAMLMGTFTTDDVWATIDPRHTTHERRAMGAVMRQLQRSGDIVPTDLYVPSARPECHRRPIRVWRRA